MRIVSNPPDAASLMMSARSFGNYDLAGALADLIDNSLKAHASLVNLTCCFNAGNPVVRIQDDGHGMSPAELLAAMRPASTDPRQERPPDDLGRFGWGMKSASFSQCRLLTVLSSQGGVLSGAQWDLDDIDDWAMGVLSSEEAGALANPALISGSGTEVIWQKCDRLSEGGSLDEDGFTHAIASARRRLALVFHRFLQGEVRNRKLSIRLNGTAIEPHDPYLAGHAATQTLEKETLRVGEAEIEFQPFILPHYSKLLARELEDLAGEEGLSRNQGFYLYRGHRLIIHGTWFQLMRHSELSQIVRIRVDVPNSLDEMWKITVDKSDAQLPAPMRQRFRSLVALLKARASRVHRARGGRMDQPGSDRVWDRIAVRGQIRYRINRDHPLLARLLRHEEEDVSNAMRACVAAIEHAFPVTSFGNDFRTHPDDVHQTITDSDEFREFLSPAIMTMLLESDGKVEDMIEKLRKTEPFKQNWNIVEEFLKERKLVR